MSFRIMYLPPGHWKVYNVESQKKTLFKNKEDSSITLWNRKMSYPGFITQTKKFAVPLKVATNK